MSFFIKWLTNFFFENDDDVTNSDVIDYKFQDAKSIEITSVSNLSENVTHRSGVITFISETYGLIDNALYFEAKVGPKLRKLNVGDTVRYVSLKVSDREAERIIKIDEDDDEFFENDTSEMHERNGVVGTSEVLISEPESTERVLNGKISVKNGEELFIHPLNIHCTLDNVRCDFIPIEGDWVSVVAEVSVDSDLFSFYGEILHIKQLKPLLVRNGIGTITYLNDCKEKGCKGAIENEIYFSTDFCQFECSLSFGDQIFYMAIESDQGKYKWRALSIRPTKEAEAGEQSGEMRDLTRDKHNVQVDGKLKFGPLEIGQKQQNTLTVKNKGPGKQLIERCIISPNMKRSQLEQMSPNKRHKILIEPGESVDIVFECTAKYLGLSTEIVVFQFNHFKIGKCLQVDVVPKGVTELMDHKEDKEIGSVQKKTIFWKNFDLTDALVGKRTTNASRFKSHLKIISERYSVPEKLFKIVLREDEYCHETSIKTSLLEYVPCLKVGLNENNYKEKFHTLLYLEEIQSKIEFRKYDLHGVILRVRDKYFTLDVPEVANSDVPFPVGTAVVVTQPWSEINTGKQMGYIQDVRNGLLFILFHESFHSSYNESKCDVMFQPIRTPYLRCHQAVDIAVKRLGMNWLFPTEMNEKPPLLNIHPSINSDLVKLSRCEVDEDGFIVEINDSIDGSNHQAEYNLKWFNPNLNALQRDAVANVLEGRCRPLPYVILGPPGTGKTLTIVEIIMQVFSMISDSRLLIGTPSNSAADIICHYLISTGKFTPGELVRLLARTRVLTGNIPENLIPYCAAVSDEDPLDLIRENRQLVRMCNSIDCIGTQRIVISTCNTIGLLHSHGFNQGHFSHIIIDEAAQANEPEALIPISFLDPKRGQVVLSGDTEQLGPVCIGFKDNQFDLSRSFLERITKASPYLRDFNLFPKTRGFNPLCITRLCINYRSVPEILTLPSRLFYDSELVATVSQETGPEAEIIRRFNFESDKRKTPPAIIFHAIRSQTYQEEDGYSWYNPLEIWQSICYLKRLYAIHLAPEDIGIITPYRKQVEKLRMLLSALNLPVPKIGSVEEFQGEERYAIILTTVRSSLNSDDIHSKTLGFLASPRRVNVAISRARALLIIVGNPFTLRQDPYWSAVIQYCINNNSCTGCPFENYFTNLTNDS